jgi:hypothetical protein
VGECTPRPLCPRGKSPRYPLDRGLGGRSAKLLERNTLQTNTASECETWILCWAHFSFKSCIMWSAIKWKWANEPRITYIDLLTTSVASKGLNFSDKLSVIDSCKSPLKLIRNMCTYRKTWRFSSDCKYPFCIFAPLSVVLIQIEFHELLYNYYSKYY